MTVNGQKLNYLKKTNFQKLTRLKKTGEVNDLDSIKKKEDEVEESKKRRRKRISKDVSQPKDLSNKFSKDNKSKNLNLKEYQLKKMRFLGGLDQEVFPQK